MITYICEFQLIEGRWLTYKTKQLMFTHAQAAFGSYCAKNHHRPLRYRWRVSGSKEYIN